LIASIVVLCGNSGLQRRIQKVESAHSQKNIGAQARLGTSKILMSLKNTILKYEEYKMEVEGAYDDVVLALNANNEIEIVKC